MFDSTKSPRKNLKTSVGAAITMLVLLSACSQQSIDTDDKQLDQTTAAQQVESTTTSDSTPSSEQTLDQSLNDSATSADGTFSENSSDGAAATTVAQNDQDLANQVDSSSDALPPADAAPSMSPMADSDPLAAPAASASVGSSADLSAPAPAKHVAHKKHKKHGKVASHKKHKKHGKKIAHKKSHKKDLPAASQAAMNSAPQIDAPKEVGSTLPTDAALSAPVDQMPTSDVKAADAMNAATPLDPTMSASPTDTPMAEPLALSAPSTNWKVWGAWAALMVLLVGAFVIRMKKRKAQGVYYNP